MLRLFKCSTCFEQLCAQPQEDNCMNTTSGIITVFSGVATNTVIIPDVVLVQLSS